MKIEQKVIDKIKQRQKVGLKKYGVTVEDNPLTSQQWLIHLQEELLDGAIYIEKILTDMNNGYWKCTIPRCGQSNTNKIDRCAWCHVKK